MKIKTIKRTPTEEKKIQWDYMTITEYAPSISDLNLKIATIYNEYANIDLHFELLAVVPRADIKDNYTFFYRVGTEI